MAVSIEVRFPQTAAKPMDVAVNGISIPRDTIVREMQHHPADKPAAAWKLAARALVIRELLLQRAAALGLTAEPLTADGRRETDTEALMRMVLEREVTVPEPDDAVCRRYYERNLSRFRSADMYEASHILFAALPSDAEAYGRARADAEAALSKLREQPNTFSALAQAHSCCASAAQNGNLGQLTLDQVTAEFGEALKEMAPGELCAAPVATRYGIHIIRLERKLDGKTLPYEAVTSQIAEYLRDGVNRRAAAQYVARLVSSARIDGVELAGADTMNVH